MSTLADALRQCRTIMVELAAIDKFGSFAKRALDAADAALAAHDANGGSTEGSQPRIGGSIGGSGVTHALVSAYESGLADAQPQPEQPVPTHRSTPQNAVMPRDERSEFEAWALEKKLDIQVAGSSTRTYLDPFPEWAWRSWLARAAQDRSAEPKGDGGQIARQRVPRRKENPRTREGSDMTHTEKAAQLRALAEQAKELSEAMPTTWSDEALIVFNAAAYLELFAKMLDEPKAYISPGGGILIHTGKQLPDDFPLFSLPDAP